MRIDFTVSGKSSLRSVVRRVLLWTLYLGGGVATTAAIGHPGLVRPQGGLIPILRGEAHNPYARRVLAPTLVRGIHALLPPSVRETAERRARDSFGTTRALESDDPARMTRARMMVGNWDYALAAAILNALCIAGYLFVLRALLILLFRPPPLVADAFPLLTVFCIPIMGEFGTLAYDYPQVFVFTLGLYFIAARREVAYIALLPLSVLSKESSVLLPLVYAASHAGTRDTRGLVRSVAVQLGICVAVLGAIVYACRHHPGALVQNHFMGNLEAAWNPNNYFVFQKVPPCPLLPRGANVPVPVGWNLPVLLVLGTLIAAGWREAPSFLKRAFPCVFVPLLGFAFFFGIWSELRDYYESLPLLLLLLYAGVTRIWPVESGPASMEGARPGRT